ncbi:MULTISPECIES: hypothetical protein [unclassified Acinetobacter]|uniref:hypothetical protein n=1 Tax=unclassified Acinetobacter TaxID=196816 RepID=UPI001C21F1E6|nr:MULTISPECIES: hypothetical protein [unclassified Acinetobacter]
MLQQVLKAFARSTHQTHRVETIHYQKEKDKKLAQALSTVVAAALGSRLPRNEDWIDQSQSTGGKLGFSLNTDEFSGF